MIRLDSGCRVAGRAAAVVSEAERAGLREKVAKGDTVDDVTVPVIVAPLLATNDTDTPVIAAAVTVATCVPGVAARVHFTDDLPLLSVVVDVVDNVPPVADHVSATPDTGLFAASSTCTTSAESSDA